MTWNLEKIETDLWKAPPEPLLDQIASRINSDTPLWEGTPTALAELLGVDMKPNVLTMRLNINASRLLNEYGIRYESSRCHDGRRITLHRELPRRVDA